jgi:hypothetical protein
VRDYGRRRLPLLIALSASGMTTLVVAVLALNDTISPEWFFGAPAIGATATSAAFAATGRLPAARPRRANEIVERFELLQHLLLAEDEVEKRLRQEIVGVLAFLEKRTDYKDADAYLGYEQTVRHLRAVEERRVQSGERFERLLRERAEAEARLVALAHEQGVVDPHALKPGDLAHLVLKGEAAQARR